MSFGLKDAAWTFATGGLSLPFTTGMFGGGGGGGNRGSNADEKQAELLRRDYNRYIEQYRPLEDYLFDQLADWNGITASAQKTAMQRSDRAFELGEQQQERQFRGLGITLDQDQRKSLTRQYDMAAAKSAIDAANQTGRQYDEMQYGLVGGFSRGLSGGG